MIRGYARPCIVPAFPCGLQRMVAEGDANPGVTTGAPTILTKLHTLLVLPVVLVLAGCAAKRDRDTFERQIEVCSVAEDNGLLEDAVEACGAALAIAEERAYEQSQISGLLYRLGRLERQRGRFREAGVLVNRSLALEEPSGNPAAVASRLIELSFSLSGQDRWTEGARLLERAAPLVGNLSGQDRKAAANAYRMFGIRLDRTGHAVQAGQFKAIAEKLAGSQ